jgi:serine/threonine-protein kinase
MPDPTLPQSALRLIRHAAGDDEIARRLWGLWQDGQRPRVEEFLAAAGVTDAAVFLAVLRVDQSERFRMGEWVKAETYLAAFPAVRDDPELTVDLVFAEFLLREEAGQAPADEEYLRRFPAHAEELRLQLELHRAMATVAGPSTRWGDESETLAGPEEDGPGAGPGELPAIPGFDVQGILGRGGMGVVYRACQVELNRPVALKMVTAGALATPSILARFRVEAEAVARARHPNIVQIHDVGQHAGAPFLVLELAEGGSLAHRIAGTPQPARWADELVETLARAIHAAHGQGVIHRDLTPANILLTADGTPKVTDFGLAKLLVSGSDLRTQTGELLGTPSYMAPEQAAGRHREIGPATDVYALGAILYELLTGRPPFKAESALETLHQVMSDDPVPPTRLRPKLPRDPETIALKCLHKEPQQRYATAGELADDLRRHLDGHSILARPVGPTERLRRWCLRNRAVAALGALALGLAVALVVSSMVAALRLRTSRDEARAQRNLADENFREARRAVEDSFTTISESVLVDAPGLQPLRKRLLEGALKYYQGFVLRLGDRPEARADLAAALGRVARITAEIGSKEEALRHQLRARGIYQALLASRHGDAHLRRELARSIAASAALRGEAGRREEAVSEYRLALSIQQPLADADPADPRLQDDLATSESGIGVVLEPLARTDEALDCYERAIAIRERLAAAFPDSPGYQSRLAVDLARIGALHRDARRLDQAIRSGRRAIPIHERLIAGHPEVSSYRSRLANAYRFLGICQRATNRLDEALESYQKAREAQEALVAANPAVTDFRHDLAGTFNSIANVQRALGRREEAVRTHRRALGIREALVLTDPGVVRYQNAMAASYNAIAINQAELHRPEESLRTFQRFRDRMEGLLDDDPRNVDARQWLSSAWHNMGEVLVGLRRPAEAESAFRSAIEQKRRVVTEGPRTRDRIRSLGNHHLGLAEALLALGRPADAAATLWEQRALWDGDADGLYRLASGLAQCRGRVGADQAAMTPEQRAARALYGDRVMEALRRAVAAGFRDTARIQKDPALAPLSDRDDFRALSGALAFPEDPFAPAR